MLINVDRRVPVYSCSTNTYIVIVDEAYRQLTAYVAHFKTEISGCGLVERIVNEDKSVQYVITEVFLPSEQKNTYASTDIDTEAVHKLVHKLAKEGKDTEALKMHWHSHASMGVFHSGTDVDNYADLDNGSFLVSLVLNHAGEVLGGLHFYGDLGMSIKGVPVYVYVPSKEDDSVIRENIQALEAYTEKHRYTYYGRDYSKSRWDVKEQKYVPIEEEKPKTELISYKAETIVERKIRLGEKFNKKFEFCPSADASDNACYSCPDLADCTDYWADAASKGLID